MQFTHFWTNIVQLHSLNGNLSRTHTIVIHTNTEQPPRTEQSHRAEQLPRLDQLPRIEQASERRKEPEKATKVKEKTKSESKKEAKSEKRAKEPAGTREQVAEASNEEVASSKDRIELPELSVISEAKQASDQPEKSSDSVNEISRKPAAEQQHATKKSDQAIDQKASPKNGQNGDKKSDQSKQTNAPVKSNGVKQTKETKIVEIKVKRAGESKGADRKQQLKAPRSPNAKEEKKSSIRESRADKGDSKQRLTVNGEETKKRSLSHSPARARPTDQLKKSVERQAGKENGQAPNKPPNAGSKTGASMNKKLTKSVTGLNELKANAKPIKKAAAVRKWVRMVSLIFCWAVIASDECQ